MFSKNRKRSLFTGLAVLLILLALPALVSAGGWAVISLDQLPENVIAGQPYPISFTVRQHGLTPIQMEEMRIEAVHVETGAALVILANPGTLPGQHEAALLFPQAGLWHWSIQSGLFPIRQPMPDLRVAADAGPVQVSSSTAAAASGLPPALFGLLALVSFAAGVMLIVRNRGRSRPAALGGAGLIVLCAALAFDFYTTSVEAASRQAQAAAPLAVTGLQTDAHTGRQLFIAKGCVVCHLNERALAGSAEYSVSIGPDLTAFHSDPAYLRLFLADPASVRAASKMPDLDLSDGEIEALVAFINNVEDD